MTLTPYKPDADDRESRYSRQVLFPGIGRDGQQKLGEARVVVIGVGATGAATASLLARAGVGHLTLIDRDFVELSNLQRQILFDEADAEAGTPKTEAARRKILAFNSDVAVESVVADLVPGNAEELLGNGHLLLDCTDNFETRYLVNDFAVKRGVPWIYAAAIGAYAATMNILPAGTLHATGCLACLFPDPPSGIVETCDAAGILGAAVNLAASLQTAEALKLLTGQPHLLRRTLLSFDLWANTRGEISNADPDPACLVCGQHIYSHLEGSSRAPVTLCGRNAVQIHERKRALDLASLQATLALNPEITQIRHNALLLRFERGEQRVTVFPDGRALIQGTTDPALARTLYARFIGS